MRITGTVQRAIRAGVCLGSAAALLGVSFGAVAHARPAPVSRYGGTFRIASEDAAPDCLDPQKTGLAAANAISSEVVDTLLTLTPQGHYAPDLAVKWSYSSGGKRLTLNLRHGVRFSNGDPFTANAVKYTIQRALNPATKSPASAADFKPITNVKVINRYTVQLTLSAPSRVLLTNLTVGYTGILDPKTSKNTTCQKIVGTGPYKIQSVAPAFSTVTLARNDRHNWNPSWIHNRGRAYVSKVVVKTITSPATAVSELITGEVDDAAVPGTQLPRVKGNHKIKLYRTLAQGEVFLGFNFAHAPLNNTAVRKAIAQAIDKKAVLKVAYQNLGVVADSPLGNSMPYHDKKAAKYDLKHNAAAARRAFASHHVTGPLNLVIIQAPAFQAAAELIQAELGADGVRVNIVPKGPADYFPAVATGKFDLTILGYGYPDPDILYQLFHSSQLHGGLNLWGYSNSTVDKLLTQGRESAKLAPSAYDKVQKIFDTQAVMVPLVDNATPFGLRTRVKGYQANSYIGFPYQSLYVQGK